MRWRAAGWRSPTHTPPHGRAPALRSLTHPLPRHLALSPLHTCPPTHRLLRPSLTHPVPAAHTPPHTLDILFFCLSLLLSPQADKAITDMARSAKSEVGKIIDPLLKDVEDDKADLKEVSVRVCGCVEGVRACRCMCVCVRGVKGPDCW